MRRTPRSLLSAIALALAACQDAFAPPQFIPEAQRFDPPQRYHQLYLEMQDCSGHRGNFSRVRWYQVPNRSSFLFEGQGYSGYWWSSHDIVLAGMWIDNPVLVRHEMLHDILDRGDHPEEYFIRRCGLLLGVLSF